MANDPSTAIPAVVDMQEDWVIVDALMGGTKAMRKAGKLLLEQMPEEDAESYRLRLNRSTLHPAYAETIQNMTGRVFAEPIMLGDNVPAQIKTYAENIDRQGNNLQVWAQNLFGGGLGYGLNHVLVEYPQTIAKDGSKKLVTKADEIAAGVRPYAIIIRHGQVLGWKAETKGGEHVLSQFRFMESVEEPDPDNVFLTKQVMQVRVLEPGKWEVYRKAKTDGVKDEWVLYDEGLTTLNKIPLATFYTKRTGFMTATPPLMELAHLAVKHWNEQSDQDKSVRFARIRLAVITGVDDDGLTKVKISSDSMLALPANADVKVVQGSAESVNVGRSELEALEDQMRIAGAKLLHKEKQATKTAAQAEEEAAQEMSPLETMAGQLEDCLDQVLQLFAEWMKLPEGGNCQVNGNFDVDYDMANTLPFLQTMNDRGRLSNESFYQEVQRRGVLDGDRDWETEKTRIAEQGPALGAL